MIERKEIKMKNLSKKEIAKIRDTFVMYISLATRDICIKYNKDGFDVSAIDNVDIETILDFLTKAAIREINSKGK